jgi:EmrB/QacA subfamily drug resistance transporter
LKSSSGRRRLVSSVDEKDRVMSSSASLTASQRRRVLVVLCVALALVVSAVASLNIALPEIATDLGATQTELQWIVDAYALVFAGLLLPAGALGDRFGRKGVIVAGLAVLAGAYLVAVFATAPETVIAARAVAGIGAAAVMPVTLSIITTVFPPEERDRAVATWAGVAGAGAVLGLLVSGTLLEVASWEWVFAVNAAWAAAALLAVARVVPTSSDPAQAPLDPAGALLSAGGLAALVLGVIEGPQWGWTDARTVGVLALGFVLLAAFVAWELRQERPMLDPRLFRERGFSSGTLAITLQFFALFGFLFVLMQYLQFVLGYSPLQAAVAIIPMAIMLIAMSRGAAPRLIARFGARPLMAGGLVWMAGGLAVLSRLGVDSSYWHLLAGLLMLGIGAGLSTAPATSTIVGSLPRAKQGVASAVNDTSREVGGALGIAVLGSILTDLYASGIADATRALPERARETAGESIAFVLGASDRLGPRLDPVVAAAKASFVDGLGVALAVAAGVLLVTAVAVALRAPRKAAGTQARAQRDAPLSPAARRTA